MPSLQNKRIILGVTGSIAAIKAPTVARELVRAGASVTCVMTESAEQFVTREDLEVASGQAVITSIFSGQGDHPHASSPMLAPSYSASLHRGGSSETWHVHLARSADAMLIAPCSASAIGMLRAGIYDNAVTLATASLPKGTPLVIVPAMDEDMWLQPAVQENLAWLKRNGVIVIEPVSGLLASGLTGMGRMPEPENIVKEFVERVGRAGRSIVDDVSDLRGKHVLITGGPTYEPIDAVRFVGNRSSGKMAAAMAIEAKRMGADVTLVMGPSMVATDEIKTRIDVESAEEMMQVVSIEAPDADIIIMSAAVADFAPEHTSEGKMKKGAGDTMTLTLKKTPDILAEISKTKRQGQIIVGFALEKGDEAETYARKKLVNKNLDMIVLNNISDEGAGFGYDTNKITIFVRSGEKIALPLMTKEECARAILNRITSKP
jgi:phosphopantothenoylcysteine decarboxylase/phosphopantothenate--cysteine ligase